jgi:uncharacterized membrane protein
MLMLVAGLVVFIGSHLVPALPQLRGALVARLGEGPYKAVFSLLSLAGLALIIGGYALAAPGARWFAPSPVAIAVAPVAVPLALVLLAAANLPSHIRRALKHPMLLGIMLWAAVHLFANGDARGSVLFGSFLGYAVVDLISVQQRHVGKPFTPNARYDLIAIVAGVSAAAIVMALHRMLFGVAVVPWGL